MNPLLLYGIGYLSFFGFPYFYVHEYSEGTIKLILFLLVQYLFILGKPRYGWILPFIIDSAWTILLMLDIYVQCSYKNSPSIVFSSDVDWTFESRYPYGTLFFLLAGYVVGGMITILTFPSIILKYKHYKQENDDQWTQPLIIP